MTKARSEEGTDFDFDKFCLSESDQEQSIARRKPTRSSIISNRAHQRRRTSDDKATTTLHSGLFAAWGSPPDCLRVALYSKCWARGEVSWCDEKVSLDSRSQGAHFNDASRELPTIVQT
eukprot:CAMPEP_0170600726 /NCGR_PEP_ID=MMETSP0224-20130122/17484_1 /TAXON_ID=285029 /ORGANISM="Togula jolla, Strain CCCM 725" /LENGTH=118 /DNA_ID=CAMNT_0010925463 /DNA_START=122 /DNA_END=475 /DNA_ORIENTATION=-